MKRVLSGLEVEVVAGDITRQPDLECVVNAANALLLPGGGVAGAIHRVAGPGLLDECLPLAPIRPGEAVLTGGHHLPNKYVVHCLGPIYGQDEPSDELLASCYQNALKLADQYEITSIGFPSISTGIFRFPMQEASRIALNTVARTAPQLQFVRLVRFILFGETAFEIHADTLGKMQESWIQ